MVASPFRRGVRRFAGNMMFLATKRNCRSLSIGYK